MTTNIRGMQEYFATLQIRQVDNKIDQKKSKYSGGMAMTRPADILLVFVTICRVFANL